MALNTLIKGLKFCRGETISSHILEGFFLAGLFRQGKVEVAHRNLYYVL